MNKKLLQARPGRVIKYSSKLLRIFGAMQMEKSSAILVENKTIRSSFLKREVKISFYYPPAIHDSPSVNLLLINDGQDLPKMQFSAILRSLYNENTLTPVLCVGIHCSADRKMEYGVAGFPDFKGRGAKAGLYTSFVLEELMPFIQVKFPVLFAHKGFAGFSLGGLMALDIVWNYPKIFTKAGIFSGSLWWRNIDQTEEEYDDDVHRIMHQRIRNGVYHPGLKLFFQCGNMDETKDRNNNGIIDSIEDTRDLMEELVKKGYSAGEDIGYLELSDGRHDVATWGRAMPVFLKWAWGNL